MHIFTYGYNKVYSWRGYYISLSSKVLPNFDWISKTLFRLIMNNEAQVMIHFWTAKLWNFMEMKSMNPKDSLIIWMSSRRRNGVRRLQCLASICFNLLLLQLVSWQVRQIPFHSIYYTLKEVNMKIMTTESTHVSYWTWIPVEKVDTNI